MRPPVVLGTAPESAGSPWLVPDPEPLAEPDDEPTLDESGDDSPPVDEEPPTDDEQPIGG